MRRNRGKKANSSIALSIWFSFISNLFYFNTKILSAPITKWKERARDSTKALDSLNEITVEKVYWLDFCCWCTQRHKVSNFSLHTDFIHSAHGNIFGCVGLVFCNILHEKYEAITYWIHLMKIKPFRLMCTHTDSPVLSSSIFRTHKIIALILCLHCRIGRFSLSLSVCVFWIRSHQNSKYAYTMCPNVWENKWILHKHQLENEWCWKF